MPILLALAILAFVALLWTTIAIAGFVRRARRRRRRRAADAEPLHATGPAAVFYTDLLAPLPAPVFAPIAGIVPVAASDQENASSEMPALHTAVLEEEIGTPTPLVLAEAATPAPSFVAEDEPGPVRPAASQSESQSAAQVAPVLAPVELTASDDPAMPLASELAPVAVAPPITSDPEPGALLTPLYAAPPPPPLPEPPPPPRLRSFPTRISKHTLAAVGSEGSWPRLPAVGTDYGDLSDPVPSGRRDESRARSKARTR